MISDRPAPPRGLAFQAGAKLAAEAAGRLVHFGFIYAAQLSLGPAVYGHMTYALALGLVAAPVTDLGLQLHVARDLAGSTAHGRRTLATALGLKLALALLVAPALAVLSLSRPPGIRIATFVLALAMLSQSFVELYAYAFRGLLRAEMDASLMLLLRAATAAAGVGALAAGFGIGGVALAYLAAAAATATVAASWLAGSLGDGRPDLDPTRCRALASRVLPLGAAIVVSMVHARLAVFLLDAIRTPAEVADFGVAQKLVESTAMIPAAVMAAVFPAAARTMAEGAGVPHLVRRSAGLLALAGTAVAAAGFTLAPAIVRILYGTQYSGAVRPLQVLALSVVFTFVNYALTHFMIVRGRTVRLACFSAATLVANLAAGILLIPAAGAAGAAAALVVSEALLLLLCVSSLRPSIGAPAPPPVR
jgi:O-antigen/teichoic acid export membrane protein